LFGSFLPKENLRKKSKKMAKKKRLLPRGNFLIKPLRSQQSQPFKQMQISLKNYQNLPAKIQKIIVLARACIQIHRTSLFRKFLLFFA
jgi:hypothetical protein